MYKILLSWLLITNLTGLYHSYTIDSIKFELLDKKFRLSIPNDPDIKWVAFNVNINKEFRAFEAGQLSGIATMPQNQLWSYEFNRNLQDSDIVYIWLAVQHNRLVFRDMKDPISVEAFKSGNPNYVIKTTTTTESSTKDTSLESTRKPINLGLENKICYSPITKRQSGGSFCRGDLIFEDNFNSLNQQYWTNEIRIPPSTADAEFVLYNGTVGVEGGILKIDASLNGLNIKKDSINLEQRCTSNVIDKECVLQAQVNLYLPPITTGRINTKDYFNFKYGRVEIRAKLPKGDWLFPLIALVPSANFYGAHYKSGEMRIAYARGNTDLTWQNKNIGGNHLFGGAIFTKDANLRDEFMKGVPISQINGRDQHFGDNFHLYTLTWTPDQLIMAVDGHEYGRVKANFKNSMKEAAWNKGELNAPLDQMFHITLGLSAGGHGDFPDESEESKPWQNTDPRGILSFYNKNSTWYPTWSQPSLQVDYVRVYAI